MVLDQLVARGIRSLEVLRAMERVPRHRFVEEALGPLAYNDHPLSIGQRQTISQPFVVARMLEVLDLKNTDRVLEVGTGCGYQSALLAMLTRHVYSIERISQLLFKARHTLKQLGFRNISLKLGDGTLGWVRQAPFEAIIVAAAGPGIPQPYLDQLAEGGRMVLPVGDESRQELIFIRKASGKVIKQKLSGCRFVQLKGKHGFSAA
jgi:protein-L-isoaspartate(D-aspartate) O-methyltransferase